MKTRNLTITALFAALICLCAPWTIPVGPIPITLATFAVYLAAAAAGWKIGAVAVVVYVLLGAVGLPVFSGFAGGIQKLFSVTGGYIVGYIPCAVLTGLIAGRKGKLWTYPVGMLAGTAVLYLIGTVWYCITTNTPPAAALAVCVLPFLPGDAVKIVAVSLLGYKLRPLVERYRLHQTAG